MYNRKVLKQEAKQLMAKSKPHYMLVALVYILLTTGLSYVVTFLTGGGSTLAGILSAFLNILISLFSMVMMVGFSNYALCLTRGRQEGMGDLFEPFGYAGRSIGMRILTAIYIFLWSLLAAFVFVILVAASAFLMEASTAAGVILLVVAYIALIVAIIWIALRYAMVDFALADNPNDGAGAAIRRSVQIVRGHKGKLFVLMLSFIGWNLLVALIVLIVLGVGVVVSGTSGILGMFTSIAADPFMDPTQITEMIMSMSAGLTLWTVLAEVICLPLTLWLSTYQQVSYAKFYDYVSGYDYHRYMNVNTPVEEPAPAEEPVVLPPVEEAPAQPEPSAQPEAPAQPDFYRSPTVPVEEEPTEEAPEEVSEEVSEEAPAAPEDDEPET